MGKDSVNISAPNLVNICVDSMDSGVYHGRLYHKYQQEPLRFNDVGALFQTMEKLFDECGYPQNTTQSRTFYRKKEKSVIKEMVPDIDVTDIMTHRTDMIAVEDTDSLEELVNLSIEHGYSRIPVYHEDQDNIIGIIYIKDLLKYVSSALPKDESPKALMREAYYVPSSKNCGKLFNEMTEKRIQMAVVVDEYGGTAGIVTMEDLVEAIVGNIKDE